MMKRNSDHNLAASRPQQRSGFTLTEMLVATALVVLIMLMFAQIYGSAVGSIREQRGLANNDQKARSLETTIRQDLQRMTYRQASFPYGNVQGLVPLATNDDILVDPVNQRGYFFYAENGVNDDTDDILQFTVQIRSGQRGDATDRQRASRFIGRAANLGIPNEPEEDDGISGNGLGSSRAAEIVYFLRGGNLYRRVMLLRDPPPNAINENSQPTSGTNRTRAFHTGNRNYGGTNYYDSFDFAATRRNNILWFHSIESLSNNRELINWPIAVPHTRFGFNPTTGDSVETLSGGGRYNRFTMEETSNNNFLWPGQPPSSNPYTRTDLVDSDGNNVIDEYEDGNRVAEDIIATNVEAFDVERSVFSTDPDDDNDGFVNDDDVDSVGQRFDNHDGFIDSTTDIDTWHPRISTLSSPPSMPWRKLDQSSGSVQTWSANNSSDQFIAIPALQGSRSLIYRRIQAGNTGSHRPELPPIPGTIVRDGGAVWECVDNRVPLRALRITVRFRDVGSRLPRQITIVHSFVE